MVFFCEVVRGPSVGKGRVLASIMDPHIISHLFSRYKGLLTIHKNIVLPDIHFFQKVNVVIYFFSAK
jgi:hypothetical protein